MTYGVDHRTQIAFEERMGLRQPVGSADVMAQSPDAAARIGADGAAMTDVMDEPGRHAAATMDSMERHVRRALALEKHETR